MGVCPAESSYSVLNNAFYMMPRPNTRRLFSSLLFLAVLVMAKPHAQEVLKTVHSVDLIRYQGTWYEIARLPNRFQDHCAGDVTANYRKLEQGGIAVTNRCRDHGGEWDEAIGFARVVDPASNAKLEVSFVSLFGWHLFWGDYWIISLDQDYQWVIVGEPGRDYGWVLARSQTLSSEALISIDQQLTSAGYDPDQFISTQHSE